MILVGLTGGIGSGKSSVSARLASYGAVIIDADAIVRELQAPGQPLLERLAAQFGGEIIRSDGSLDRPALAALAFGDPQSLADLNALVHPAVGREMTSRIETARTTDKVVVLDIPLLAENPREGLAAVVVVDSPIDLAVERLVRHRHFERADAEKRAANQSTREARRQMATFVVTNDASLEALHQQVDDLWPKLRALPATTDDDLARYRGTTPGQR